MKFISFGDLRKIGDALLSIGECITRKDISYRKENELYHETLRKDFPGSYGNFLNAVDNNRIDPVKAEELRRQNAASEEKTRRLEAELEQQKQINQALRTNTAFPVQYMPANPNVLAPQPSTQPNPQPKSLESSQQMQPNKVDDFFSKMYGK